MTRRFAGALVLFLASGTLLADEVWLKNDCVIEGTIVLELSDRVVIKTAGGKMEIQRDQIREIVKKKVRESEPPPATNGEEVKPQDQPKVEPKPPVEETKPPKEEAKPPKEEVKPPKNGEQPTPPPKPAVEAKTPSQREFLELLDRRAQGGMSDGERASVDERLGELSSQDLQFTLRVLDAGPMNRFLQVLGVLAARKDPIVLPEIEKRLANDNPTHRAALVAVLGLFEGDEHIARLRDRLANEAPVVQAAILDQFERRGYAQATEDVLPLLGSPTETVRKGALAALKRFASVRTIDGEPFDLGQHLAAYYADEPDGALALDVLRLLADIGGTSAVDALRSALGSEDVAHRTEAVRGLGQLAARAATMDVLALAEEDIERSVRLAAIKALELIKDAAATERLIAMMDTDDAEVLSAVHRTLKVITNQTISKSYDDWAAWWASQH